MMTANRELPTTPPESERPGVKIAAYCLRCPFFLPNLKLGSYGPTHRVDACAATTALIRAIENQQPGDTPDQRHFTEQQIAECATEQERQQRPTIDKKRPSHWLPAGELAIAAQKIVHEANRDT